MPSRNPKWSPKDRVTFWLIVVTGYFVGTLGLAWLIGVYMSPVRVVVTGFTMLAAWSSAGWVSRRFAGRRSRR